MPSMPIRPRPALAAALGAAVAAGLVPATPSAAVLNRLRVDAERAPLSSGVTYVHDSTSVPTDPSPSCGGSGDPARIQGPTPLGLLAVAGRANRRLRPLRVNDTSSFGLFVCGIGASTGSRERYWLYKVDHELAELGAGQLRLRGGEDVLWYFVDTARGINTGGDLELVAPARARPGRPFTVSVRAYDDAGARTPAAGAEVLVGDEVGRADARGRARVTAASSGGLRLRAQRGADVPSASVTVCVDRDAAACPRRQGEPIVGTDGADRIAGTRGGDRIRARGGDDHIDVRSGDLDRVTCGPGRDTVLADARDAVSRSTCERIRRS